MMRFLSDATDLLRSQGPGGSVIRRLLPATVAVIAALAFLRWLGEQQGFYSGTVGVLMMTVVTVLIVGALLWFFASGLDRSEANRVRDVELTERQTRRILETAHDAFVSIDADGRVTNWNPQAEASFGWSREEMLGRELAAVVIPERFRAAHRQGIESFLATGESSGLGARLELTALHRSGREFPVELTISPLATPSGVAFHAFLRDITERRSAQEQLALARDQALEASRQKSMFVANVSHEIRTPMNGVIGMSELLLATDLDDEQRECVETICSSGESLLTIIDDILDFSKIEAGKLELDPTDFDLRATIERACGLLAPRAHEKGLELAIGIAPEVPVLAHGDAARLRQVLANLVSNAVKFTAAGEVVVNVTSTPASDGAALVRFTVSDTGIGIGRETLGQLFKPYAQADGSTTRRYGGTGLGLAISHQLVELMGGQIGADSEPGRGSRFWFELLLARPAIARGALELERETAGLRVLVVDDNAANRRILERQLSSWQMRCEVAHSAAEAMVLLRSAAARRMPFALALLDLNMPDVDGYELARMIRSQPALAGMRLIMLTSSGARPESPSGLALDGWLTKPVRQSRLQAEIRAVTAAGRPVPPLVEGPPPAPVGVGHDVGTHVVLVVEDTPVNQLVAARMLEKAGYRARIAENGHRALEALADQPFAAVLMDCQMPRLDGYETTREIRAREGGRRRTPIIAMTANSMQGERERCLAAGMDDYLAKPLRSRTLADTLARWVDAPPRFPVGGRDALPATAEGDDSGLLDSGLLAELERLDGEVLDELVSLYLAEAAGHVAGMRDAVDRRDAADVASTAHRLKGSSRTLGAARVSHVASRLELAAKAGNLTGADELLCAIGDGLADTGVAFADRLVERRDHIVPTPHA